MQIKKVGNVYKTSLHGIFTAKELEDIALEMFKAVGVDLEARFSAYDVMLAEKQEMTEKLLERLVRLENEL
jgi:cobyric acid synthase